MDVYSDDEHLVKRGIIDSVGVFQIMMFIEDEAGTRVPDSEIRFDNFESVARIDEMVQRLLGKSS